MQAKTIILIGAGKVATHLGQQLLALQVPILAVWSRTNISAQKLGKKLDCSWTNKVEELPDADIYIILIKDDAIASVAEKLSQQIKKNNGLVVHTSGAVPSSVLKPYFENYGVFYPLQTFSKEAKVDFSTIPICIYTNHKNKQEVLEQLAKKISNQVQFVNDEQRAYLHLAAVFANNFTNYLQHISISILEEQQLPYSLLKPLLDETIKKLDLMSPKEAQTGPAIRGDQETIKKHLDLLKGKDDWQEIYRKLSEGIRDSH